MVHQPLHIQYHFDPTGIYEYTVPKTKDGSYDGDAVVKQYTSLTVNANYVVTTDQPCRGLLLWWGNCTQWVIIYDCKRWFADPSTHGAGTTGIRVPVSPVSNDALGEDISTGAVFDGMGTATNLESAFNSATKDTGAFISVPKVGMHSDNTQLKRK